MLASKRARYLVFANDLTRLDYSRLCAKGILPQSAACGQPGVRRPRPGPVLGPKRFEATAWSLAHSQVQQAGPGCNVMQELPRAVQPSGTREHAQHEHSLEQDPSAKAALCPTQQLYRHLGKCARCTSRSKAKDQNGRSCSSSNTLRPRGRPKRLCGHDSKPSTVQRGPTGLLLQNDAR